MNVWFKVSFQKSLTVMFVRYKQFNFTICSLLPEIQLIPTEEVTCKGKKADTHTKQNKITIHNIPWSLQAFWFEMSFCKLGVCR